MAKPKVGTVHKMAIIVTTKEAIGEVNGRLAPGVLVAISAYVLVEVRGCCNR